MDILSGIFRWIDRGYDDGVSRSNYVLGLILALLGLLASNVESGSVQTFLMVVAAAVAAVFIWRLIAWTRRLAKKADSKTIRHR
ncbi:hypothetical protein ATE67_18350 [Sphingopyxis sp. H050]|nr:hypothetical protein ATE67_18350 [Sphingopyxis sp. H050]